MTNQMLVMDHQLWDPIRRTFTVDAYIQDARRRSESSSVGRPRPAGDIAADMMLSPLPPPLVLLLLATAADSPAAETCDSFLTANHRRLAGPPRARAMNTSAWLAQLHAGRRLDLSAGLLGCHI